MHGHALKAALLLVALVIAGPTLAQADRPHDTSGARLQQSFRQLQPQLASSAFGRPLLLQSSAGADPQGDVYALVEHRFGSVQAVLQRPERWCELLLLHLNVKRCRVAGTAAQPQLRLWVGRKFDQPLEQAHAITFRFTRRMAQAEQSRDPGSDLDGYLAVNLHAPDGPLGTRNYRMHLQAVPVDAQRSFIRLSYAYDSGWAARLATDTYLATLGRHKVGFSVVGRDAAGRPTPVGGVRGIAERNTMRYFLAIEAYLDGLSVSPERRLDTRLRAWFAATERYPQQLREMDLDTYLAMKHKEALAGP